MPEPRRTFGPVVLLGLASGALAAVAGARAWVEPVLSRGEAQAPALGVASDSGVGQMPLAGAVALVVLACWGVLLVTRGRVRRAVAVLGVVAALVGLATTVAAYWLLPDHVEDQFADVGFPVGSDVTAWYPAALVGAALSVVATVLAVRWCAGWPEMGRRYDAPGTAPAAAETGDHPPEDASNIELWKAMDEGRDPTE